MPFGVKAASPQSARTGGWPTPRRRCRPARGRFSPDGQSVAGGWRPNPATDEISGTWIE